MTDQTDEGGAEGDDGPAELSYDVAIGATMEELFGIGMGNVPCEDRALRREAQTYVAVTMRSQGYGYQIIADEMGCVISWAHKCVQRGLKRIREQTKDSAETVREIQIERLNKLLAGCWDAAEGGDSYALQNALAIMDRIDKAYGIEPPKKVEHMFTDEARNEARNQLLTNILALPRSGTTFDGVGGADSASD